MSDSPFSTQAAALLFLHAQTSLHPGAGTALGTVDLPVQRERHTLWPLIPGSALKGILRDRCRERTKARYDNDRSRANDDRELTAVFGPGRPEQSSSHAGAVAVTDARILAFPVRSLRGVFGWVTCPAVLGRLNRDRGLAKSGSCADFRGPGRDQAFCPDNSPLLLAGDKKLVLEEFEFTVSGAAPAEFVNWIASVGIQSQDTFTAERLRSNLVVLNDDDFTHFVRHSTEVMARIGLDYETKTVKQGALFYQEFLPPESLFYAVVLANASRMDGHAWRASDVLQYLTQHIPEGTVLQIGGDETTGKGLCSARLSAGQPLAAP